LEYATVAVTESKDSALIAYTLSTKDGSFTLRNLPAERPLRLFISYVGYKPFRKNLFLKKGETEELGTIVLGRKTLSDVVIRAERQAIVVKPDTIEFAPEAFKTRPNAVLEDLLKKLPGLQVDLDGTITVNGKQVSKITIDGKDFFASDITVASKNINVDLIDKVQVLTNRENDPDKLKDESELDKVINIKLKRAIKKSVFGKMYASGGTVDRFESGGLINIFRDTLQVSLIGFGNNLNKSAFSSEDLNKLGGFGRSGTSTYRSGVDFGGRSYGLQQVASGGFNINYDWKKKGKANLMYFYGTNSNDYENAGNSERILDGSSQFSISNYTSERTESKHNINGLIEYKFNKNNTLKFQPKLGFRESGNSNINYSKAWKNLQDTINETHGNGRSNNEYFSYEHNLNYFKRFKKKEYSLNITQRLNIKPGNMERFSLTNVKVFSASAGGPDQGLNQFITEDTKDSWGDVEAVYHFPINKKLSSDLEANITYEEDGENVQNYYYNKETNAYDVFIASQSNNLQRKQFQYRFKPSFTYKFNKTYQLRANVDFQYLDVSNIFSAINTTADKEYFNVLPSVSFFGKGLSLNYNLRRRLPYVGQMQPVSSSYTSIDRSEGNPDLKPTTTNYVGLNYYKNIPGPQIDFSFNYNLNLDNNSISYAERIDTVTNGWYNKPVNIDGRVYSYASVNFGKRFKKTKDFQYRINMAINGSFNRAPFYLSTDDNFLDDRDLQLQYGINFRPGFSVSYKELIDYEPSFSFNRDINDYKVNKKRNRDFYTTGFNNNIALHLKHKVNIELNHTYTYNSQVSRGMPKANNLLNGSLSVKMLKKDRGELRLSAYDLLNQNNGVFTYGYEGTSYYGSQLALHRYFLLGYVYNFNKTVTK